MQADFPKFSIPSLTRAYPQLKHALRTSYADTDRAQFRFGAQRQQVEQLLALRKQRRELLYTGEPSVLHKFSDEERDTWIEGFQQGKTLDEIAEGAQETATLRKRLANPVTRPALEAEQETFQKVNALNAQIAKLEATTAIPLPAISGPMTQDKLDRLMTDLMAYYDHDPAWYEGSRFINLQQVGHELENAGIITDKNAFSLDEVVKPYDGQDLFERDLYHGTSREAANAIEAQGFNLLKSRRHIQQDFLAGTSFPIGNKELGNAVYLFLPGHIAVNHAKAMPQEGRVLVTRLKPECKIGRITRAMAPYFDQPFDRAARAYLLQDDTSLLANPDPELYSLVKWELMKRFFTRRGYDAVVNETAHLTCGQPYVAVFNPKMILVKEIVPA